MTQRLRVSLMSLVLLVSQGLLAEDGVSEEMKIKAAIIYKLALFVEWPEGSFTDAEQSFGLCVLGGDGLAPVLGKVTSRGIFNRDIELQILSKASAINDSCHLLFISDANLNAVKGAIRRLADRPILTVSDTPGFAQSGGMVELAKRKNRIGFKINYDRVKTSGVKAASTLLQLSEIVKEAP